VSFISFPNWKLPRRERDFRGSQIIQIATHEMNIIPRSVRSASARGRTTGTTAFNQEEATFKGQVRLISMTFRFKKLFWNFMICLEQKAIEGRDSLKNYEIIKLTCG
jgi:hypothetical protein